MSLCLFGRDNISKGESKLKGNNHNNNDESGEVIFYLQMFCKIGAAKTFAKFTGKNLC